MSFDAIRERMNATGIGYAGIEGAWWLPAVKPFALPLQVHEELQRIAEATFALFDAVMDLYETDAALHDLLNYKVPAHIPRLISRQCVLSVRPDFQLLPHMTQPELKLWRRLFARANMLESSFPRKRESSLPSHWIPAFAGMTPAPFHASLDSGRAMYSLVATELEICPSAQGYAHAMQVGYGLPTDLVEAFAQLLDGRTLLFAGTREWSAFLWEQLAFCRALEAHGAHGRVWFDAPVETFAETWQPPMFGVAEKPPGWNDDVLMRVRPFNDLVLRDLPDTGDGLMIFRFGYFDCFAPQVLHRLAALERTGAIFLNPTHFAFDSKAVMAALQLPGVRAHIGHAHLATLDRAIPQTHVLTEALLPRLRDEKEGWVLKFAGFDHGQRAWGGRSLQVGAGMTQNAWDDGLRRYCGLPFPVVAQRAAPTAGLDVGYFDAHGSPQTLHGPSRIRSFFIRNGRDGLNSASAAACGAHLTVSPGSGGVLEGMGSVQAPVVV